MKKMYFIVFFAAIMMVLPVSPLMAQDQACGFYDLPTNIFLMPCFRSEFATYLIVWRFAGAEPITIEFITAVPWYDMGVLCATYNYFDETMHIPCLRLYGEEYEAMYRLIGTNPVTFIQEGHRHR